MVVGCFLHYSALRAVQQAVKKCRRERSNKAIRTVQTSTTLSESDVCDDDRTVLLLHGDNDDDSVVVAASSSPPTVGRTSSTLQKRTNDSVSRCSSDTSTHHVTNTDDASILYNYDKRQYNAPKQAQRCHTADMKCTYRQRLLILHCSWIRLNRVYASRVSAERVTFS